MTRRYLVTGCAGFIGARVSQMLLDRGDEVLGWDNVNDAYDRRLKRWRLDQLSRAAGFRFLRVDVADRRAVAAQFAPAVARTPAAWRTSPPYDAVIHLAARAGVRPSVAEPWDYVEDNVAGTLTMLEACRRCGVSKFVLASTSSLYGSHNPTPYREDADTSRPLSPYAASKKGAESLAYTYHHLHGLDVSVLRFFTVYGPAGRPDMSVFRFVRNICEGEPITVFGDGSQQRDFTYIDDIARGVLAALAPVGYEAINLGSDQPAALRDMIGIIARLADQPPRMVHEPAHAADVAATWADITKARGLLNWSPQVTLEEGLARTVRWYLDHRTTMRLLSTADAGERPTPQETRRAA